MLKLRPVTLMPRWLTPAHILVTLIVLAFLLEFLVPKAGFSVSVAHLGGFIGSVALILCGLTFWSKARVQIGRRKLRYKTVRINAGLIAAIGLSFIVVQKTSFKMWNRTAQVRPAAAKTSAGHPLTLGSGKSAEILLVGPVHGNGWSGLMLTYRTSIPLNDLVSLRKEADEIWGRFVADVEHRGYGTAVISASGPRNRRVSSLTPTIHLTSFSGRKMDRGARLNLRNARVRNLIRTSSRSLWVASIGRSTITT